MTRTSKLILALGLAVSSGIAAPGCVVRGRATMGVTGSAVVYQEPPAPQVEVVSSRPGYVFVRGRWDWRGGQWVWMGGHWERQRANQMWAEGRWERRGNSWHWIEGSWQAGGMGPDTSNAQGGVMVTDGGPRGPRNPPPPMGGPRDTSNAQGGVVVTNSNPRGSMYPTAAPPPPRSEAAAARAGYVFVSGRWNWQNGNWQWVDGHWERERANQVWIAGRWELQGNYYVWVEGRWDARPAPSGPVIRDHRN